MENITHDFWHMVWDQKSLVIAMATNASESELRLKIENLSVNLTTSTAKLNGTYTNSIQYWSEIVGESMQFENYLIKTIDILESADYVFTQLELMNLKV